MTNLAREALTRAINRAIAEGAPRYINQPLEEGWRLRSDGTVITKAKHDRLVRNERYAIRCAQGPY